MQPAAAGSQKQFVVEYWMRTSLRRVQYATDVIAIIVSYWNDDLLHLADDAAYKKMIKRFAKLNTTTNPEELLLSAEVAHIDKHGRRQQRILIVTDKALYCAKWKQATKEAMHCKQRSDLSKIRSITNRTINDELLIEIPTESDLIFACDFKPTVIRNLCTQYQHRTGNILKLYETQDEYIWPRYSSDFAKKLPSRKVRRRNHRIAMQNEECQPEWREAEDVVLRPCQDMKVESEDEEKLTLGDFEFIKVIGKNQAGKMILIQKGGNRLKYYALRITTISKSVSNADTVVFNHPFLMCTKWTGSTATKLYHILEFNYVGNDLFQELRQRRYFTEKAGQFVVAEVVLALEYLHGLNIVSQAIQPENILLDEEGHITLKDKAMAVSVMEYLPPERIDVNTNGYDASADWWMLGVLICELMTGEPPWAPHDDARKVRLRILDDSVWCPTVPSDSCKELIQKLLVKDPKHRLKNAAEIKRQAWFSDIHWDLLYHKKLTARTILRNKP